MSKKILIISNMLFYSFVSFLFSFIWIQYYSQERITALVLSIIVASIVLVSSYIIQNNKLKQFSYSSKEEKSLKQFTNYILYSKMDKINQLIENTFVDYSPKREQNKITITKQNQKIDIYNLCHTPLLCINDIFAFIKVNNIDCTVPNIIMCIDIDSDSFDTLKKMSDYDFVICKIKDIYEICMTYNTLPKDIPQIKNKKITFADILKSAISKDKWKGYLFASVTLAFYSLFVISKIYYLIWSTILIVLSVVSYYDIFKHSQQKTNAKNILL